MTIRYIFLLLLFALAGCTKDREEPCYPHSSRVVLVYMAGDNSLGCYVQENLDAMVRGMASAPAGGRTIAYVDTPGGNPHLVEVTAKGAKTLYTWPGPHNSASPETVREVIGRVRTMAPADRYGLVLWSHGLAWMPSWATGYLTRSKARMEERWPATKLDEMTCATSAGCDPVFRPVAVSAPVTATDPVPTALLTIRTGPIPTTVPAAVCDSVFSIWPVSVLRTVPTIPVSCVAVPLDKPFSLNRFSSQQRPDASGRLSAWTARFTAANPFDPVFRPVEVSVPVTATEPASITGTYFTSVDRLIRPAYAAVSALGSATKPDEASGASAEYLLSVISPAAVPAPFGGVGSAFPASAPASWPRTKWFGQDTGESPAGYLDTEQLAQAIPSGVFDWILFDACFMASAETLYALRDKAARIVCSSAEVIADGFPYEKIMPELLRSEPDLRAVCEVYFRHYADDPRPSYRSATVSLVETPELEALAAATASVLAAALSADPGVLSDMDLSLLQPLDRYRRHFLFDMGSVVAQLETRGLVPAPVAEAWRAQLARTVPYEAHTPTMLGLELDACCGLSMYVPVSAYADLNEYYRTLGWYARCYPMNTME